MKQKAEAVFYVDGLAREHYALIKAVNVRGDSCRTCNSYAKETRYVAGGKPCRDEWHDSLEAKEHYVTLVYIDENAPESENERTVFDVPHVSMIPNDPNSSLPTYHVNCWKAVGEAHVALPKDHPGFDHPFKEKDKDQDGNLIPVQRPAYEREILEYNVAHVKELVKEAEASLPKSFGNDDVAKQLDADQNTGDDIAPNRNS